MLNMGREYRMIYGNKYEGEWKEGEPNGEGKKTWANGSEYDGEWKDGKNMVMVYINGENKLINMEKNIMVYGIMINVEEKENIFIRMVLFMKGNLKIIYIMDMVLKHGEVIQKETERNMKVIGKTER